MSITNTPVRRPWLWLAIGGALAVLSIAVLWPLQHVGEICVLIYPAPPGCGAPEPRIAVFTGVALIVALFAAMVTVSLTVRRPVLPLVLLAAAIVLVAAIALGVVALAQAGVWDPPRPPVIVN
ncbi:hypothetical protein BH11ACT4_BH11ACT4_13930 [soil metagenome]